MTNITQPSQNQIRYGYPSIYSIRVIGSLDKSWSKRLSDFTISSVNDALKNGVEMTMLTGEVIDQAALMGVLNALYNMRLTLWSVECLGPQQIHEGKDEIG